MTINLTDPHHDQPVLRAGASLAEVDGAIILLHGRGGTAKDILSLGRVLGGQRLAHLAPQAAGNSWYPHSFLSRRQENEPYLTSALNTVQALVQFAEQAGIPAERIVIAGFSQGACLATEFVASYPRRYAALVAFVSEVKKQQAERASAAALKDLELFYLWVFLYRIGLLRTNGRPRSRRFIEFLRGQFPQSPELKREEARIIVP